MKTTKKDIKQISLENISITEKQFTVYMNKKRTRLEIYKYIFVTKQLPEATRRSSYEKKNNMMR